MNHSDESFTVTSVCRWALLPRVRLHLQDGRALGASLPESCGVKAFTLFMLRTGTTIGAVGTKRLV